MKVIFFEQMEFSLTKKTSPQVNSKLKKKKENKSLEQGLNLSGS